MKTIIILMNAVVFGTISHAIAQHEHHHPEQAPAPTASPARTLYTCPMHPEVVRNEPGKCPKCGMTLFRWTKTQNVERRTPNIQRQGRQVSTPSMTQTGMRCPAITSNIKPQTSNTRWKCIPRSTLSIQ